MIDLIFYDIIEFSSFSINIQGKRTDILIDPDI